MPFWTPDGKAVTFVAPGRDGQESLWKRRVDGSGDETRLLAHANNMGYLRWSPDGKWLVFTRSDKDEESDIFGLRPGIDTTPVALVKGNFMEWGPDISPDGHWLAYQSDETGLYQIYVVPFPNTKDGKWIVTGAGGIYPKWGPRGNELFYRDTSGDVFAIPVKTKPGFSSGTPKKLFDAKRPEFPLNFYAISRDDQKVLMVRFLHHNVTDKIVMVDNWFEELKHNRSSKGQ
jgi:Tol biopolymer transport system component